nr:hypothetical protein [Tanacetum cinerariifolium]
MKNRFQMSSMGELSFFLGLQVKQKEDGIFISQDKYVAEILKKFDFLSVKTASTPIETQKPLVKDEEAADVDVHLYRSMIRSLMYLITSRPDIMFAVRACSRFQVTPMTSHLQAVKRIFRYLKGQPKLGLWYPKMSSFNLEGYSDSDYADANLNRKSTIGEAEYVAAAQCCGQVLWIQNQLLDYGFNLMNTKIYIDNQSTICIVKNPVFHSKTKHIEFRHHFIRDAYEKKLIQVLKIHTNDNVADLLTKDFNVSRRLISCQCKKQTIVATSTTEAEYVAAAQCCGQVLWIQNQLLDYGFNLMNTKIYIDNQSTICIVKNPVFHSKTKHIEFRHHFIRDAYEKKLIQVLKIHTNDNVADLLTKDFNVSSKELASPKQTDLGKDESNPLIVYSLLKTIWSSMHHVIVMKHWLFQSKRLLFWSTAKVKTVNDEVRVQDLIGGKKVTIMESSIHRTPRLDDEEGTSCLANDDIFTGLANMGYEKIAKTTSWNEFSITMESAIICLATNQKFNFSKYILFSLVKNIEDGVPFYMFPRFVQLIVDHQLGDMSHHQDIYDNLSLTKKVFTNMKRVGIGFSRVITPLFESMLVQAAEEVGQAQDDVSIPTEPSTSKPHKKHKSKKQQLIASKVPSPVPSPEHQLPSPLNDQIHTAKDSLTLQELVDLCTRLSNKVLDFESEVIDIKSSFTDRIQKLEDRVDQLEEENKALKEKSFKTTQVDTAAPVEKMEKSFKQGRMIADMDEDDIDEEEPAELEEVLEVVKAAKLMTEDEAFVRQLEAELNENINWNDVIEKVKKSERQNNKVMRYQALRRKPLTEAQARKNMMIYLKNMAGFKMDFFKGMTYSEIRPIFEKHCNSIQAFLEKVKEEVTVQEEGSWKLVKERFETIEPKNFSDDFLLNILKIMFEKPDIEANV